MEFMEALIGGIFVLLAAIVTAVIALRSKKIDLIGQTDERRLTEAKHGYDSILAASDIRWHYQCHMMLDHYSSEFKFDVKNSWKKIEHYTSNLFSHGIDQLKGNSLNYEHVEPALSLLLRVVWEGATIKMMEPMPKDYEEARATLIGMSRIDKRLDKPVSKRDWAKVAKANKPEDPNELHGDALLQRMNALMNLNQVSGYMIQSDPDTDEENDPLLAYIHRFKKLPPIFSSSLRISHGRIVRWAKSDIIDFEIPCIASSAACFIEDGDRSVNSDDGE